jgi:capsular polysaccharide biosynthesis protein
MPGVDLPTSQIQDFLQVFKRKRWSILIAALTGFTLAMIVLCFVPPKYKSFTRVEVREVSIDEEPANRSQVRMQIKDLQNVSFQVLSTPRIVRVIKDQLQWADFLQVEGSLIDRQEYLDGIVKRTVVERARKERDVGNDYVTITYRDEDPRRAAAFANKLREVWIEETIGAIRDDVQRQLDEAKRQYEKSYKDYMIATQNVQRWQEQYGLSPVNPTNRKVTSEEDPVRKEYLQAKQDLTRAESEMNRHFDIYTAARDRFASEPLEIEEPIDERTAAASPQFDSTRALLDQVKSLKDDITRLKAEQTKLKPQHKQFGLKQQDIDAKGKELKELEQQLAKAGLSTNGDKPMTRKVLNAAKLAARFSRSGVPSSTRATTSTRTTRTTSRINTLTRRS